MVELQDGDISDAAECHENTAWVLLTSSNGEEHLTQFYSS